MILAGDIGGTKTNLALFNRASSGFVPFAEARFVSKDHPGLESVITQFFSSLEPGVADRVDSAAFGIAGPVIGGVCTTPNLPWIVETKKIKTHLGVDKVKIINDLEANGFGIPLLGKEQLYTLSEGKREPDGHGALISAGTGLGEAFLYNDGNGFLAAASEGGHADFSPRNELEIELLRYLKSKWDHVSYERVLSGPGFFNVYSFLKDTGRAEEPEWLGQEIRDGDPGAVISQAALAEKAEIAVLAMDLFVQLYGAEAGNLALKCKALGGVYVGGGIAPHIIERLKDGAFMEAFRSKGRMRPMLERMPVEVILEAKTALLGAVRCASLL